MINNNYLSKNFGLAVKDYYYLLERDYPQKAALKLIGDRYRLTGIERSVLLRGIVKKETALERKKKILKELKINNKDLIVDCYNVLITISSYLDGNFIYISNDGFLRDAAESHGKIKNIEKNSKVLIYLFNYLSEKNIKKIEMFLDSPVSHSKELSGNITELFEEYNINGESYVVRSADYHLIHNKDGICSTSDSTIIDHKKEIFDLSYYVLDYFFNPDFFYLDSFLK